MIKGDFIGEVYELANDVTMVGRSDEVGLTVSGLSITRRHAMIVNRAESFHVSDLEALTAHSSTKSSSVQRDT